MKPPFLSHQGIIISLIPSMPTNIKRPQQMSVVRPHPLPVDAPARPTIQSTIPAQFTASQNPCAGCRVLRNCKPLEKNKIVAVTAAIKPHLNVTKRHLAIAGLLLAIHTDQAKNSETAAGRRNIATSTKALSLRMGH
jgi:hypothetical protein